MRDKCPGCGAVHDYSPTNRPASPATSAAVCWWPGKRACVVPQGPPNVKAETAPPQTTPAPRPARGKSESDLGTILLAVGTCLVMSPVADAPDSPETSQER